MKLKGKTALVTGAGSGIGEAIAILFAREGASIAVNDINPETAEKTAETIREAGGRAITVPADVADADSVSGMVDRTIAELGGIHVLVNNAGIPIDGPLIEVQTPDKWDRVISVILRGTYLCSRKAGEWMVKNRTGKIVNIASVAGRRGSPHIPSYGAAKAAVINLTMTLAADWGKYNINVNGIAPGIIDTPLTQRTLAKVLTPEDIRDRIPLGRFGTSEEVAKVALFLSSDDASYVSGIVMNVDGGQMARR